MWKGSLAQSRLSREFRKVRGSGEQLSSLPFKDEKKMDSLEGTQVQTRLRLYEAGEGEQLPAKGAGLIFAEQPGMVPEPFPRKFCRTEGPLGINLKSNEY